ncbi:hypothetical protein ZIOFF_033782 [Zingiber officinale]|uniref:Gag-pol polyprotein n=1 Tax=Zingiber officinale TaxID=94328 RepID=A0A8J5GXI0_ZINOF|nr:hypothetical protein ZIOFF_033782 [Zingiber officinale]
MYGRRHDLLRTYQISSQIFKLEQGSMSVTNYFATLKGLWDEFDYYRMENWSSTDDHQRYLKLLEKDRIIKFLDGLTAEFENLKGQILGLEPTPSLEQVYYKILSEEGRKRTMNNKGIFAVGPPIGETSVFIGFANKFRPGGTKRQGDRFCWHCKRTNHDSDFYWEKYSENKPEKFKHNAKKATNSSNIAVQKIENKETIGSSAPSTTGLSSTDIVNLQHLLSRLQASSSASTPADSTPFQAHTGIRGLGLSVTGPNFYSPWVIDSGATDHMTNAANSFISYSLSSGQEKVIIADGTKATVAGKGSIKLTDHFFLSSALHVPSVSINLLSVSSITKQLHCSVTFFPDHCVFQDLETKQTIGTDREGENITSSFVPQVVPQVISSPIPLDVIENKKDVPPLGKDAPSLGAQSSPDIITYKRQRRKQEPTIDRLVELDALALDPVKQLSSSVESTAPLNMNELNLPVAVRKEILGTIDFVVKGTKEVVFRTCCAERNRVVFQMGIADAIRALSAAQIVCKDVAAILTTLRRNLDTTITCKIHLLDSSQETVELARGIEKIGGSALAIHGRKVKDRPRDPAKWNEIADIVASLSIPVIANGAASVMIARGALWNTSIFSAKGKLPWDTVKKEYLRKCILCHNDIKSTKYTVKEMIVHHSCLELAEGKDVNKSDTYKDLA